MAQLYLLGINSFIGRHCYLKFKKNLSQWKIICLSHDEITFSNFTDLNDNSLIINFCGINKANAESEYFEANDRFVRKLVEVIQSSKSNPFLIHISSLMVNGFQNQHLTNLPIHHQYFINSKLSGENYLIKNYPQKKLCIIRPSNIFGYDCQPYYNNLLVTLIHEKITGIYRTVQINKNCRRNFLSIDGFCEGILTIIKNSHHGIYNLMSNNDLYLNELLAIIHENKIPNEINIVDGEQTLTPSNLEGTNLIINEKIKDRLTETQTKMEFLHKVQKMVTIKNIDTISQPQEKMIEISDLSSRRLHLITIKQNACTGNQYQFTQTEDFYINQGKVIFLLSHKDNPGAILMIVAKNQTLIKVPPEIIHKLANDFPYEESQVLIASTQEYLPNQSPDTIYVNSI